MEIKSVLWLMAIIAIVVAGMSGCVEEAGEEEEDENAEEGDTEEGGEEEGETEEDDDD